MKSIKVDFIRLKAGQPAVSSWIRRSSSGITTFGGPFGVLEKWAFSSEKNWKLAIQLLQLYTYFIAEAVTPTQWRKFAKSISAQPRAVPPKLLRGVVKAAQVTGLEARVDLSDLPKPLVKMVPSPAKRAPVPSSSEWFTSRPEREAIIDSVQYLLVSRKGQDLLDSHPEVFDALFMGIEDLVTDLRGDIDDHIGRGAYFFDNLPVGKVSFLQEPGYKLRYVANPARVFQRMLEPLGDALFELVKTLPWDCTFNQMKGKPRIQEVLGSGKPVFSVDLSSATDYFPLELQMELLRFICHDPHGYLDIFQALSRGDWHVKTPKGEETTIRWMQGQPLGLYPSFASFTLAHGMLLLALAGGSWNESFYVLGDDVVILEESLYAKYLKALEVLGCPTSPEKTISGPLAEFAGKLITYQDVTPQLKWRQPSDDNFVDLARMLGPTSLPLFRPSQRRVLKAISELPEFLGGLGWNPKGKPVQDRIPQWYIDWERAERAVKTRSVPDALRTFYGSQLASFRPYYPRKVEASDLADDLEQRSRADVERLLGPWLVPMTPVLGMNLAVVAKDREIVLSLPPVEVSGTRKTQLELWKQLLSFS
jgi:hypothetical protein